MSRTNVLSRAYLLWRRTAGDVPNAHFLASSAASIDGQQVDETEIHKVIDTKVQQNQHAEISHVQTLRDAAEQALAGLDADEIDEVDADNVRRAAERALDETGEPEPGRLRRLAAMLSAAVLAFSDTAAGNTLAEGIRDNLTALGARGMESMTRRNAVARAVLLWLAGEDENEPIVEDFIAKPVAQVGDDLLDLREGWCRRAPRASPPPPRRHRRASPS